MKTTTSEKCFLISFISRFACVNRLPSPHFPIPGNKPQTRESEVKSKHQGLLTSSHIKKPTPSIYDLLWSKIDGCMPSWLLHVDWMEERIGNA
jgi:hypothetical protein